MGIYTTPNIITVLSTETSFPFTVEWADALLSGESLAFAKGYIYDNSNGIIVQNGFKNVFGVNGTQAQYIIQGNKLNIGHFYTAVVTVDIGSTKTIGQIFLVSQPE